MPISTEAIKEDLDKLDIEQLQQVADFITFLQFRAKRRRATLAARELAALSTEFADEDRALAESGMGDYAVILEREDQ